MPSLIPAWPGGQQCYLVKDKTKNSVILSSDFKEKISTSDVVFPKNAPNMGRHPIAIGVERRPMSFS